MGAMTCALHYCVLRFLRQGLTSPDGSVANYNEIIDVKLEDIRGIAKEYGIKNARKLTKTELVREIQRQEGNYDCYATARVSDCGELNCQWRDDCYKQAVKDKLV